MANDMTVCALLTVWQYRYPRLLGRVWYTERFGKNPYDPDDTVATLNDPKRLKDWLNSRGPGDAQLPNAQGYGVAARRGIDGLVLYPEGLLLPWPDVDDFNDDEIRRLALHASTDQDVDIINKSRRRFASWVIRLTPNGQAEALARQLQASHGWAVTDHTLDRFEKALDAAIFEVWKGFTPPDRFEARVNELLQAGGAVPGFSIRVDPRLLTKGGDHFNRVVFDADGARIPNFPLKPNQKQLERLEEAPPGWRTECSFEPC